VSTNGRCPIGQFSRPGASPTRYVVTLRLWAPSTCRGSREFGVPPRIGRGRLAPFGTVGQARQDAFWLFSALLATPRSVP
jgi:hypothetical protein